ncbi:DUF5651 domain-containing protein [Caloramator mitchellensis]|nr:DUF5651 domain-containing protein [Caloramator mitchellensis]
MFKRDYLQPDEMNDFLILATIWGLLEKIIDLWDKRQMISKEEKKNLKLAKTYIGKFYGMKVNELSRKTAKKVAEYLQKNEVVIIQTEDKEKMREETQKFIEIEREDFYNWCEQIIDINCKNCRKNHQECKLYDLLDKYEVPDSSFEKRNCRYAYDEINIERDEKKIKEYKEFKKRRKGT